METKICTKCRIEKELSNIFFMKAKTNKDGLSGRCRQCTLEYKKQYYKENIENSNIYYKKHFEHIAENKKQYQLKRVEQVADYNKQYYEENKDKIRRYNKQHSNDKDNMNNHRVRSERRRSLKKQLLATLTTTQWEQTKKKFNNKCAYCGEKLSLVQEHFLALSKGGEYTTNNIIPSCVSCNSSKKDKDFFTWYPKFRHYNEKREKFILKYLNYKNKIQQLTLVI